MNCRFSRHLDWDATVAILHLILSGVCFERFSVKLRSGSGRKYPKAYRSGRQIEDFDSPKKHTQQTKSCVKHVFNTCRASTSYFFPIFSYFFLFFQNIPLYSYFCSEIPIFSLIWNKIYRYLQVCSYMTISASVEKFSAPTGASILH